MNGYPDRQPEAWEKRQPHRPHARISHSSRRARPRARPDRRDLEEPRFHRYLTGRENLRIVAATREPEAHARIDGALARVGLSERADDRVKTYSLGMRQRLGVARVTAVGVSSLMSSRGLAIGLLLGWHLAGSNLLLAMGKLDSLLHNSALEQLKPGLTGAPNISLLTAAAILVVWTAAPGLGGP